MRRPSYAVVVLALSAGLSSCDSAPRREPETPPNIGAPTGATSAIQPPVARSAPPPSSAADARFVDSAAPDAASPAPATPARPLYYDRALTNADLTGRTLRELSLLRNTIFARAGNAFRRPWLDAYFRAQPWYAPRASMDASKITPLDRANAQTIANFDAAITKKELERRRDEVLARKAAGALTSDDAVELSLLSQRLGIWVGGDVTPTDARSPLEDPSMLDRLLRVDELRALSRRDLRILRNTVYARRGRPFTSEAMSGYFEGVEWYKADKAYTDKRLTEIDQKNIQIIQSVEQSLGGPLPDHSSNGQESWFGEA